MRCVFDEQNTALIANRTKTLEIGGDAERVLCDDGRSPWSDFPFDVVRIEEGTDPGSHDFVVLRRP